MIEVSEDAPEPRPRTRDYGQLRVDLDAWLARQLPAEVQAHVSALEVPESNGMSSDTVLFELVTRESGRERTTPYVARLEPELSDVPVFQSYDFAKQFRVMRLVADRTEVPVPATPWLELDAAAVGSPFFVMERVSGQVPPDVMPYTFGDNWFGDAAPADQRHLQDTTLVTLARLHELNIDNADLAFLEADVPGDTALRRHVKATWGYYEWVAGPDKRSPLLERCFAWLDDHWPADEGPTVLSWGDARIGNVLYRDFEPVGVLDWEMAGTATREVDLGWMLFLHRFFQDLTEELGMAGLPDLFRVDEACATYEQASGHTPRDLHFYLLYSALRHGIIMSRIGHRMIASGQAEMPDDPDDLIMHRETLRQMLDGTYWAKL